jgi:hypothetical protein
MAEVRENELGTALARHHGEAKPDGMRFGHIRTHEEDAVGILHVFLEIGGRAATE